MLENQHRGITEKFNEEKKKMRKSPPKFTNFTELNFELDKSKMASGQQSKLVIDPVLTWWSVYKKDKKYNKLWYRGTDSCVTVGILE